MSPEQPHSDWDVSFGQRLAAARRQAGRTKTDIARCLDTWRQQVALVERGLRRMTVRELAAFCTLVDISPEQLLYGG